MVEMVEMVKKRIDEDKPHSRGGPGSSILRISNSLLSEEIMSHQFSKKFIILSFDYYTGVIDLVQHLRAFQVKKVVHPTMTSSCVECSPLTSGVWP